MNARKSLLIVVNNTAGGIVGIVSLFFIGQYLTPAALGMVAFAMSMVNIAGTFTSLGVGNAHVKRISEGQDLDACIGTFRRLKVVMTLVSMGGLLLGAWIWDQWKGFTNATTFGILAVLVLNGSLQQFRATFAKTFQALRKTALSQAIQMGEYLTRVPAVVVATVLVGAANGHGGPLGGFPDRVASWLDLMGPWSAELQALLLAGTWVVAQLVSTLVGWWHFRRQGLPWGRFDRAMLKQYMRFAGPLAILALVSTIAQQADVLMVGYFWSATETGYYFAAQRFLKFIDIVPLAVGTLFFPLISELAARRQTLAVHEVARTTQRLLSLAFVPIAAAVVVFREDIIRILIGNAYLPAAPILTWLVLFTVLRSLGTVSKGILQGYGLPRTVATLGITAMVLNIVLNVVFIPTSFLGIPMLGLKAEGAAMATAIAQGVAFLLMLRGSRKASGSTHFGWFVARHAFGAGVGAGAVLGLRMLVYGEKVLRIWDVGMLSIVGALVYIGVLVAIREVTRKDYLFFLDLLHPGRMVDYVKGEIRIDKRRRR